jgi:hypothetical protein
MTGARADAATRYDSRQARMARTSPALPAAIVAAAMAAAVLAAQEGAAQLLPVDEAASRPDFFSFRAQLQRSVARHDVEAVLGVVSPGIRNTFGDDDGIDAFRRLWRIGDADSPLWDELGTVLALGGSFQGPDTFVAPYTFSRWPDRFDAFEHVVLTGANVRIRSAPQADAPVRATLSFAVLPLPRGAGAGGDESWQPVRLEDGGTGYVASQFARSPVDYRAIFTFTASRWRLATFVAGD